VQQPILHTDIAAGSLSLAAHHIKEVLATKVHVQVKI
jgi:hypothetical protein